MLITWSVQRASEEVLESQIGSKCLNKGEEKWTISSQTALREEERGLSGISSDPQAPYFRARSRNPCIFQTLPVATKKGV